MPKLTGLASVCRRMSIDKNSTGLPKVDLRHDDTKINLAVVVGVVLFLVLMGGVAYLILRR